MQGKSNGSGKWAGMGPKLGGFKVLLPTSILIRMLMT